MNEGKKGGQQFVRWQQRDRPTDSNNNQICQTNLLLQQPFWLLLAGTHSNNINQWHSVLCWTNSTVIEAAYCETNDESGSRIMWWLLLIENYAIYVSSKDWGLRSGMPLNGSSQYCCVASEYAGIAYCQFWCSPSEWIYVQCWDN